MSLYNDLTDVLTPYANKIKEVNESLDDVKAKLLGENFSFGTWTDGYYKGTGADQYETNSWYQSVFTDKIPCSAGEKFLYCGGSYGTIPNAIFYNDNTIVSGQHYDLATEVEVTIPSGANYVRFQATKAGNVNPTVYYAYSTDPMSSDYLFYNLQKTDDELSEITTATTNDIGKSIKLREVKDGKASKWSYVSADANLDDLVKTVPTNFIVLAKCVGNSAVNTNTGEVVAGSNYVTNLIFIPNELRERVFSFVNCVRYYRYDDEMTYLGMDSGAGVSKVLNSDVGYVRVEFTEANKNTASMSLARVSGENGEFSYNGYTDTGIKNIGAVLASIADGDPEIIVKGKNLFDYKTDECKYLQVSDQTGVVNYRNNFDANGIPVASNEYVGIAKYFPVSEGQTIFCNYQLWLGAYYDSNKTFIGAMSARNEAYLGWTAPAGCAYVRINIKASKTVPTPVGFLGSADDLKNVEVYVVDNSSLYAPKHKEITKPYQIDGSMISDNYLDKVVPNMNDSEFLSAMRCMAIREVNKRDHAWRFGNFNMWIMANIGGWDMTRKMLMDYGVDFCGFEECVIARSTNYHIGIAEFLKSWQFPSGFYTNWTDGSDTQIDKSFVSRYQVTSSEKLSFASAPSNASYLNCKVSLPRYMDVYNPYRTLSVYIVHFAITTPETKIAIAKELLTKIATDTSDFVVILGDTNDFGTTDETKDYWVTLEAGGFRPVIPITTKTVTEDGLEQVSSWAGHCIDQFLISDNIDIVSYGVVNTKDEYAVSTITGSGTDNEPALSDHDFVYCDLKFNYDRARSAVVIPE